MNHQQSKLEETGVKTAAVADGVENSLQHIDGIREKMDVLGQSGSAIRDVVEGLSAIYRTRCSIRRQYHAGGSWHERYHDRTDEFF